MTKGSFTRSIWIALFIVAFTSLNAWGASTDSKKLPEIRIPDYYDPTSLFVPYIAEALGYFEEEGVKPVFTGVIAGGQHLNAVVAGTNDIGGMHVHRPIAAVIKGAKVKCIVAGSETTKEIPHMEFVVLEKSEIKEPKDLFGKKVGVVIISGCSEYTAYEYLRKNVEGVDTKNVKNKFTYVTTPPGTEETALRTGEIDVASWHGRPQDVFDRGGVRVLFDDYDVWKTVGGATPFYTREDFIKKNPEAVRGFVNAIARANNWINANREEAKKILAKRTGVKPEQVQSLYLAPDGIIKEDSIQQWVDIMLDYGEIKIPIDPKLVFTNDFNRFYNEKAEK